MQYAARRGAFIAKLIFGMHLELKIFVFRRWLGLTENLEFIKNYFTSLLR